ncbi:MAG: hypothetical protein ACOYU4_05630 [Thermodesulfobacteriota bacterium]
MVDNKGNQTNIVEWLTLLVVIIGPIVGFFFVERHIVNKTKAETEQIRNQIETFNKDTENMLTELRLQKERLLIEGNKTSNQLSEIELKFSEQLKKLQLSESVSNMSIDAANLIRLIYPQFILRHVETCLLNSNTVRVKFMLKNAGELPLNIEHPTVEMELDNGKSFGTKGQRWDYFGPYNDYPAKETEFVFFDFNFLEEKIPKKFKSKIIFKYKTPKSALGFIKEFLNEESLLAELEEMTKGTFTMRYNYNEFSMITQCK